MKKLSILLTLLFCIVIFSSPFHVSAASNVAAERLVKCLSARTGSTTAAPLLTGQFFPGSTVFAVACTGSEGGRVCGTGNAASDGELFANSTGLSSGQVNVKFYDANNPTVENPKFTIDNTGTINVNGIVSGTNTGSGAYEFFGVEIRKIEEEILGGAGAQQQATFTFESPAGKNCAKISWAPPVNTDPYGVVFDSVSLEPLSAVAVTIRNAAGVPIGDNPSLRNNLSTGADGVYNYLVPPGDYTLTFQMPAGYEFKAAPRSSSNMEIVYGFTDKTPYGNVLCTIYKPNEVITETGLKPECRNIPLEPVSVPPSVKDPVSLSYSMQKDEAKGIYILDGKVSHPLTTVVAFQNISGVQKIEIGRVESNNSGFYTLEIPLSNVLAEAPIGVEFVKSRLLGASPQAVSPFSNIVSFLSDIFVKKVGAQTSTNTTLSIDPPPTYVEGYAYDEAQQVIPNATVQVKLKNGDGIFYQTKADVNGYFFIAPRNLPTSSLNLEFYLNFIKPTGENIKYRIYEFTQANKYYFSKESISLLTGKKKGVVPVPQAAEKTALAVVPLTSSERIKNQQNTTGPNSITSTNTAKATEEVKNTATTNPITQQIVMILVFIVTLGVVGVGAVMMIMKNKPTQQI